MNPVLPGEVLEFGAAADKAFAALGGVEVARRAEQDPALREAEVATALAALGISELDPRADADSLAAAATLCQAAGRVALPYPVLGVLLADGDGRPLAVVPDGAARADHGDLFAEWRIATVDGTAATGSPGATGRLGTRLGPFVTDLTRGEALPAAGADVALHLALTACQVLGTADRAVELAVDHVTTRVQFGKPISAFQAVQFQVADAAVAVSGLRELTHFTLWRLATDRAGALADALALRLHAIDVARSVLRTSQQLHGAAGVCDEYDVSVLARHVQPALRLPWSAERTAIELAGAIARDGFVGLFPHGGDPG